MTDTIQYIDRSTYIILYRMFGDAGYAMLPDRIDGKPVTELADHAFSDQPSAMYPAWQIKTAYFHDGLWLPEEKVSAEAGAFRSSEERAAECKKAGKAAEDHAPALAGRVLASVTLPDSLTGIGNYAFYGCDKLREISFPDGLARIGSGLFNTCPSIRRLVFRSSADEDIPHTPYILQEVLRTISHEVEAVVLDQEGKEEYSLIFPEYYEEPKENTPGRIIETIWHGTGYQYRQCFLNRKLEFVKYDRILPAAHAQEAPETVVRLALDRLKSGVGLTEESQKAYTSCLKDFFPLLMDLISSDRETDLMIWLRVLDRAGFYTSQLVDTMIDSVTKSGRADAAVWLMDLRRRKFAPARRSKYEF